MQQSQTVKTLFALVISMTIGTFALVLLQTDPIREPAFMTGSAKENPAKYSHVIRADVPVIADDWDKIIYHTNPGIENTDEAFHFIISFSPIDGVSVAATDLWKTQRTAEHPVSAGYNLNSKSIRICLNIPDNTQQTNDEVHKALKDLCGILQDTCDINNDMVYPRTTLP